MVGFPGETPARFERVLEFLDEAKLDRVGAFVYSPEEGTKAASLPGQVPDKVKRKRYDRLMAAQSRISRERNALFVGKTLQVLIEEVDGDLAWGRSYREAPEVDGMVCVENGTGLTPGSWVESTVVDFADHDVFAKISQGR